MSETQARTTEQVPVFIEKNDTEASTAERKAALCLGAASIACGSCAIRGECPILKLRSPDARPANVDTLLNEEDNLVVAPGLFEETRGVIAQEASDIVVATYTEQPEKVSTWQKQQVEPIATSPVIELQTPLMKEEKPLTQEYSALFSSKEPIAELAIEQTLLEDETIEHRDIMPASTIDTSQHETDTDTDITFAIPRITEDVPDAVVNRADAEVTDTPISVILPQQNHSVVAPVKYDTPAAKSFSGSTSQTVVEHKSSRVMKSSEISISTQKRKAVTVVDTKRSEKVTPITLSKPFVGSAIVQLNTEVPVASESMVIAKTEKQPLLTVSENVPVSRVRETESSKPHIDIDTVSEEASQTIDIDTVVVKTTPFHSVNTPDIAPPTLDIASPMPDIADISVANVDVPSQTAREFIPYIDMYQDIETKETPTARIQDVLPLGTDIVQAPVMPTRELSTETREAIVPKTVNTEIKKTVEKIQSEDEIVIEYEATLDTEHIILTADERKEHTVLFGADTEQPEPTTLGYGLSGIVGKLLALVALRAVQGSKGVSFAKV